MMKINSETDETALKPIGMVHRNAMILKAEAVAAGKCRQERLPTRICFSTSGSYFSFSDVW